MYFCSKRRWLQAYEAIEQLRQENEELRRVNQRLEEQFYDACMSCTELEQRLYWMRRNAQQSHKHRTEIMATNKYGKEIITKERAMLDLIEPLNCLPFKHRQDIRSFYTRPAEVSPHGEPGVYTIHLSKSHTDYEKSLRIIREYFSEKALDKGGYTIEEGLFGHTKVRIGQPAKDKKSHTKHE